MEIFKSNKNNAEVFDYENFDYEKCLSEVLESVKKPNIMICGSSGVGKSSLINDIFGTHVAEVGNSGVSTTRGIHEYKGETINLFDTEGFEIGREEVAARHIFNRLNNKEQIASNDFENRIHEVWYCINGGSKRFLDFDKEEICKIRDKNIPVMIVITKIDTLSEDELIALKNEIAYVLPSIPSIFSYSTNSQFVQELKAAGIYKKFVQRDEMVKWAIDHLDEALREGFVPSLRSSLAIRRNYIISTIVKKYSTMAGAVVIGTSFINVPFSDSVPLMSLQVKMAMSIINAYGIKSDVSKLVGNLIGTTGVSYFGRTLASQLISVIPFIGNTAKASVNTTVAVTITGSLGAAITLVCEQYLKACIKNNGANNLPFSDFLTVENLKRAISFVQKNKSDFGISDTDKKHNA